MQSKQAAVIVKVPRRCLQKSKSTQFKSDCSFNGKTRECHMVITLYGNRLIRLGDIIHLTSDQDLKSTYDIAKIYKVCPALHHGNRMLSDHIQVRFSYFRHFFIQQMTFNFDAEP